MRRNKSYDDVFLERSPEGYKEYRIIILEETKIDSDRYIQDIDRTLLKWIHEITGSGSKASQSIRSSKSNDLESFISSSTINPRSITTSKSIRPPIQIDVMNDTTEEQVVPCGDTKGKQHNIYNSNNDDGVDLERYKDLLTEGKTYRGLNDHHNRNAGFEVPISPFEKRYHQGCNSGIKGAVNVQPIDQEIYMADVSQHGVQNQKRAHVTPRSIYHNSLKRNSKVNFIEDHNHASGIKDTKSEWKNVKPIINDSIIPEKDYQMRRTQNLLKRQALT